MVTAATSLLTATIPMIVATGGVIKVTEATFKDRKGKPFGTVHYHFKGKKTISHQHEGGHISHYHKGLKGYGRTRKRVRR